jgi:peptidoglycan/xylan/chitin deacetylase (PgdA/CDA1 family)
MEVGNHSILSASLSWLPVRVLMALAGVNPAVVCYHIVSDEQVPHVKHLYPFRKVEEFRKDLEVLCKFYHVVSLHDLIAHVATGKVIPKNSLLLTFDDGFREVYDVIAPILFQEGVPATFFLATAFLDNLDMADHNKISLLLEHLEEMAEDAPRREITDILSSYGLDGTNLRTALLPLKFYRKRQLIDEIASLLRLDFSAYLSKQRPYLTSRQVSELISEGFTIGAHSVDHPPYCLLTLKDQLAQTRQSMRILRESFSLRYAAFAFPFFDNDVPRQFFEEIVEAGDLDVSFGSAGMLREAFPWHFQRFSVEQDSTSVTCSIHHQYVRSLFKKVVGRQVIDRNQPRLNGQKP